MNIIYLTGFKTYIGTMFRKVKDEVYILDLKKERKASVHTYFCLQELDIFLVNEKLEIVESYKNIKPFRVIFPKNKFRYIIEGRNLDENKVKNIIKLLEPR